MRSPRRQSILVALVVASPLAAVAGCNEIAGHPPVARASATPDVIPENDGFQTPVTLDASESADPIDDPDGTFPLDYAWEIRGDEFRFASGDAGAVSPVVELRGDRPATIELTVTDEDGLRATVAFQLRLTVD